MEHENQLACNLFMDLGERAVAEKLAGRTISQVLLPEGDTISISWRAIPGMPLTVGALTRLEEECVRLITGRSVRNVCQELGIPMCSYVCRHPEAWSLKVS